MKRKKKNLNQLRNLKKNQIKHLKKLFLVKKISLVMRKMKGRNLVMMN